jgi:predicted DNA-binding protein (MmcQ/YjbR family)
MNSDLMALRRLRKTCLGFPEAAETTRWGHPTFVVGRRAFAVFDEYRGERSIAFRVAPLIQAALIRTPRYFAAPYAARHGWVCAKLEGLRWGEVAELLRGSYRLTASKRVLGRLDPRQKSRGARAARGA